MGGQGEHVEAAQAPAAQAQATAAAAVAPPRAAAVLALQRTAGNAATVRALGGRLLRQSHSTGGGAAATYHRARTVSDYVALVRAAEALLTAAGATSVDERIQIFSGIYYGTDWSLDYDVEQSQMRNQAFQTYTTRATAGRDPRPILGTSLFAALKASQDITDPHLGAVDIGHVIIGLNARSSWTSRNINIPSQGATGLEITTWVGDLGGAAAQLARRRVHSPSTPATAFFGRGTDYGADSNLEGDIGAYLAGASATATGLDALTVSASGQIADTLADYFGTAAATSTRGKRFLQMVGGTFSGASLTNRADVEQSMADKFHAFGRWYMGTRYGPGEIMATRALLGAAAADVATAFVDWLLRHGGPPPAPGAHTPSTPAPTTPRSDDRDLVDRALDLVHDWL